MTLYFAFGSNMSHDQMLERCPNSIKIGIGYLENYKIAFTTFSRSRESAVADIVQDAGNKVWGVIYKIPEGDLTNLDRFEGHPNFYKRNALKVCVKKSIVEKNEIVAFESCMSDLELCRIEVQVYEVVNKAENLFPKLNYLEIMLDAAVENHFPDSYYMELHNFGKEDYGVKLVEICDELLGLKNKIDSGEFRALARSAVEWGGANLVITGSIQRKEQLNKDYPHDLVVLTPFWKELSWLVTSIYSNPKISWQIDNTNKHYFLRELGLSMIVKLESCSEKCVVQEILLETIYTAYRVITTEFYKSY